MNIVFVEPEGGWVPCPTCKIEKEAQYLEDGKCPQCGTYLLDDPDNPANALTEEEMAEVAAVEAAEAEAAATDAGIPASSDTKPSKAKKTVAGIPATEEKPYIPRNDVEREAFEIAYTKPVATIDDDKDREIRHRILCRRRLMPFIRKFRPKYLPGWVHVDICQRLEQFVKDVEDGKEPRLLLMMPPRAGKQLADDTLVPTPQGWKRHGDLKAGDEVFHPSGVPVDVLAVSEKTPSNVKVTFSDGSEFYCHENHEWTLYNRLRGEWQTVETRHFLNDTRFGVKKQVTSGGRSSYQLPIVEALRYTGTEYTMHPYVLGAWLGDGSAGKPCITGVDPEIVDRITVCGYKRTAECKHTTTKALTTYFSGTPQVEWPGRMTRELQELGIYTHKRIPTNYQYLTVELRLHLLAGLIDTDGTTDENSRVSITTVSEQLADDIMQLCTGLGFRPYKRAVAPKLSTSGIQGRKTCYVVGFQPTCHIPVALERKRVTRFAAQRRVGLAAVERVDSGKQGHCIEVDSPDGLYVVGEQLTATHNSEIGSRHFPAWVLGKHPEWEIIAASHTSSLTMSFSRYVRDLVKDPVYGAIFSGTKLDPSSQSVENWNILGGGGYLAAGVGTGITGRGAHILLLDDLVKDIEAADSQTIRDNTWEWYASTAYTRLAPGGGVIGIMTWWHDDDWAGRIQQVMATGEGDKFEIIKYPAINDYGDEYILEARPHRPIQQFMPGHLPDAEDQPRLVRVKDTAIHPARYTTAMMQRIKKNLYAAGQQRVWNALYQQNPAPDDGLFFTKEMFRYYSTAPSRARCTVYQTWDFAITEGSENDYTVGTTLYQDERDALYVIDVRRFKSDDSFFIIDTILDYAREYDADLLGFEDGQIWKALQSLFDKRCDEREQYPAYEILKPLTDKMVRASPLRGRMQLGKVYFDDKAPWFRDLYHEMTRFPAGKHDDQIDSLAWGARLVLTRSAPRPLLTRQSKQPKSWKAKLNGIINGSVGATHMSA